jgi:hypothetical protein
MGEPTREAVVVLEGMKDAHQDFAEYDLKANVRLETCEPDRCFHVPPPTK